MTSSRNDVTQEAWLEEWYDHLERQESSALGVEEPDTIPPLVVLPEPTPEDLADFGRWMDRIDA